eukprot:TRINITY_DN3146_c0_g1_i2.p1 TRINITY_DN3146_c0_g1~~TRINITY_DN3146_c0_g1_i2.p1  ORF type:complete len:425 (+),score=48.55 TRINITY_DN3146_c0_g1_i2:26-1276(+)
MSEVSVSKQLLRYRILICVMILLPITIINEIFVCISSIRTIQGSLILIFLNIILIFWVLCSQTNELYSLLCEILCSFGYFFVNYFFTAKTIQNKILYCTIVVVLAVHCYNYCFLRRAFKISYDFDPMFFAQPLIIQLYQCVINSLIILFVVAIIKHNVFNVLLILSIEYSILLLKYKISILPPMKQLSAVTKYPSDITLAFDGLMHGKNDWDRLQCSKYLSLTFKYDENLFKLNDSSSDAMEIMQNILVEDIKKLKKLKDIVGTNMSLKSIKRDRKKHGRFHYNKRLVHNWVNFSPDVSSAHVIEAIVNLLVLAKDVDENGHLFGQVEIVLKILLEYHYYLSVFACDISSQKPNNWLKFICVVNYQRWPVQTVENTLSHLNLALYNLVFSFYESIGSFNINQKYSHILQNVIDAEL